MDNGERKFYIAVQTWSDLVTTRLNSLVPFLWGYCFLFRNPDAIAVPAQHKAGTTKNHSKCKNTSLISKKTNLICGTNYKSNWHGLFKKLMLGGGKEDS